PRVRARQPQRDDRALGLQEIALVFHAVVLALLIAPAAPAAAGAGQAVSVTIDPSEAQATLAILSKLHAKAAVTSADWNTLFATAGYRRLKEREAQFKRTFTDDDFKAFVASPQLV